MKKRISCILVMVLLASAVPMAVMPAAAYEEKIPCNDGDNELTKAELVNAILSYMLGEEDKLDDAGDASYVYAYWDGEPKTIIDQYERSVTFYRPVERVISTELPSDRIIVALDRFDRLVGAEAGGSGSIDNMHACVDEMRFAYGGKLIEVVKTTSKMSGGAKPAVEVIASLRPDVIFSSSKNADVLQEQTGTVVVVPSPSSTGLSLREKWYIEIEKTGAVLEREGEAEDLISFMEGKLALVTDITSQIPDSEKPRVYFSRHTNLLRGSTSSGTAYALGGGILVSKDAAGSTILKEQLIDWDPDIILIMRPYAPTARCITTEDVLLDPELSTIKAIRKGNVYYTLGQCRHDPIQRFIPEVTYLAKLYHPDKFEDLDLEKEGNEIMEKFFGGEGLYTWLADEIVYLREFIENPPTERVW